MKTFTGSFWETIRRRVEFVVEAESEDDAKEKLAAGDGGFSLDEEEILTAGEDFIFDPEPWNP